MVKKGRPLCREHVKCRRFCLLLEIIAGRGQKANRMGKKRRYIHRLPCNIIFHGNVWIDASVMQMRMLCRSDEENRGGVTKMSKAVKKKSRRMWRTMRKTLGALFLVSALVIAAIPVDNLQAADPAASSNAPSYDKNSDVSASILKKEIPRDSSAKPIQYTTEDRKLIFEYFQPTAGGDFVSVIVGYGSGYVEGNALEIPNNVNAYRQYTANQGQDAGYAAVGRSGNFLFYRESLENTYLDANALSQAVEEQKLRILEQRTVTVTVENPDGTQGQETRIQVKEEFGDFKVCFLNQISAWKDIDSNQLYYYNVSGADGSGVNLDIKAPGNFDPNKPDEGNFKKVSNDSLHARIENVAVNYIYDNVFEGQTNIASVSFGPEFRGVGEYAFAGSGINSLTFSNGLEIIGENAFEDCIMLQTVTFAENSLLGAIGARAFKGCSALTDFKIPWSVSVIGDSAFEGCERLASIDLCSEGVDETGTHSTLLRYLGQDVFKNCKALKSVTFPDNCLDVYISLFQGCALLESITMRNSQMDILDDAPYFGFADFKAMLGADTGFYFEGIANSKLHETCKRECFPFSYIGDSTQNFGQQDRFEITLTNGSGTDTFVINRAGMLLKYGYTGVDTRNISIPAKIGPSEIVAIDSGVFKDCCNLEQVTIPEKVAQIGASAFQGCHNLEWVTFTSDNVVIGDNAFTTQVVGTHQKEPYNCPGKVEVNSGDPVKKLHFLGNISPESGSYSYAMSSKGKYSDDGFQNANYIIYCSGLPQNLEVVYNPNTSMSELVKFPSLKDFYTSQYNKDSYAYLEADYTTAAYEAVGAYMGGGSLVGAQQTIIDSALKIEVPNAVQSIKPGLFKEKDEENFDFLSGNNSSATLEMSATVYSLATIESGEEDEAAYGGIKDGTGTFAGCKHLVSVDMVETDTVTAIKAHAFQNCESLREVGISPTVSEIGICPFYNCGKLSDVNFKNSPYFVCERAIIYALGEAAEGEERPRVSIVQCLVRGETEIDVPEAEFQSELMNISEVWSEAFRGSNVRNVNLRSTSIETLRTGTFADTDSLQAVYLPSSLRNIENYAVAGSSIDSFYVYGTDVRASSYAFYGIDEDSPYKMAGLKKKAEVVSWFCMQDENTRTYETGEDAGFLLKDLPVPTEYTVNFEYYNTEGKFVYLNDTQKVTDQHEVVYPEDVAERITTEEGLPQTFEGWELRENTETNTWTYVAKYKTITWTVTAMDSPDRGSTVLGTVTVVDGFSAENALDALLKEKAPEVYDSFNGWSGGDYTSVKEDIFVTATYVPEGMYVVKYYAMVGSYNNYELYKRQTVLEGEDAPDITPPGEEYKIPGYSFAGWRDLPTKVDKNWDVYAKYVPSSDDGNSPSPSPSPDSGPSPSPGPNPSPSPSPNPNPSPSPSPGPNGGNTGSGNNANRHTLQVRGGSGSGLYAAGEQIIITADAPARGQQFTSWTVSPASTVVTDKTLSSFILTMPNNDVAVIANYKASAGGTTTGSGNTSSTNTNRPNGTTGTVGGTTVVIDKNGLSNTGVVSATVNGSSDNFTIKITESSSAAEAVLRALQAEYGSLDNIKYFPMDISLYDSTGNTKITDTTGLSVSITLPLPDSLITYAGNNKVAGVVNDKLDKLTPRFTTISGVPCITFTAEHFSPYVIYVDIANLSDGTITDDTPTTGDGIHPKWFLSIGLACLSFVMFMMKDNKGAQNKGRSGKKQKVAVRARN